MVIMVVIVMIIIVVMLVMVIIVIMVLLVFMVIMVIRTDRKTRTNGADRTETRDMTFKPEFPCDLCKAAFTNLAMFNAGMIFCLCCIDVMLVIMNCVTCEV